MAERRFVKRGEYELFLDEDIYDTFLNMGRCHVYVLWHGWHRLWQPSRESSEQLYRGALFRDRHGSVQLDLLMHGSAVERSVVKLKVVRPRDSVSVVVKV